MIGKKFSQLRLVVLTVSLLLIQLVAFSQNIVSVSFTNGAIGTKGNNAQDLQNLSKFQTLQLSKAYFIQNSSVTTFQVQGNDITGTLRLVTNTSNYVDIPGKMVWSANGNPNTYMGFLPSPTLTSFNLSTYGGASYVIDNTKNFALVLNNRTVTFTDGSNIGGNASSPLGDLNAYLATFNNAKPVGPVTVTSQTTSSTNPTITGTATLGSGESLSIEFNGVIYTTGITYPTATTWSWTVPNTVSLAAGTYNVVATITNADGYTLSDVTNNELVISSANFASLGCITIVASGSQAEGTTWTFSNNTISPNSSSPVFLNPSDVLAKMALGDLTISSPCITISENVIGGSHTNALFLNSNKITQAAGVSVTTQGGNITYSAINSPQTSSLDRAITIGATTGTRSVVNANGGNILMNASFASTGTVGGNDGDFAFSLGISDIITSSTGSINLTGDATNSVNAASSTYHAWGLELGDTRIQTASGAITLTGIGGKLTPNSRGIVVWVNRIPRILSASGQITLIDQKPSGFTSPYVYNGLFLYPSASSDLFIGADGTNIVSSSSNVIIRADKMDLYNNAGKLVKFNTSGTVIFESVGTSFEAAPTLDGLSLGSTVSGFTLGKTTNTSNLTLSAATTIAGPVIVHGGVINGNANITSSTASAISLFGKSGLRFSNAGITLQTQGGDLILSSDYDANSVGNIISEGALTLTSNGGAIRLGGGPTASSFAYGMGVGSRDESPGIWVKGAVTINSGNGDISVKGYTTAGTPANASKLPSWGIGLGFGGTNYTLPFSQAAVTLNSGTGKIFMEGWARNPTAGSEGSSLGIIFNNWEGITTQPLTITSANTTADAIVLIGNTENTVNGQRTKNSLRFWSSATNITATGAGGGITLSGKTFAGNDHPQIGWSGGNILATSGPITISTENQGLLLDGDLYLGSRSGVSGNTTSSSTIRFSVDNYVVASGKLTRVATTGPLTIEAFGTSFKDYLSAIQPFSTATGWSFNENGQTMSALTIGKTGNASALTVGTATTVAGPVSVYGGDITLNGAINTSSGNATADVLLKSRGTIIATADIITNGGDITLWSDADANGAGGIRIDDNVDLDSRTQSDRTANTNTAGGGKITLAGGLDDGGTASGVATLLSGLTSSDGYPDGYAVNSGSAAAQSGIVLGTSSTATGHNSNININSGGGDIRLHGLATTRPAGGDPTGLLFFHGYTINAGDNGNVVLLGNAAVTSGSGAIGMDLAAWREANYTASGTVLTKNGNISVVGRGSGGTSSNLGMAIDGIGVKRNIFAATGTGTIRLNGLASGTGAADMRLTNVDVLATSGAISLITEGSSGIAIGGYSIGDGLFLGRKASSLVTTSSSNVMIQANRLSTTNKPIDFSTNGTVTIEPFGSSFGAAQSISNITFATTISSLNLGKTSNTANLTLGAATTIAGPVSVYGGDIALNESITTSTNTGHILIKAAGNIRMLGEKTLTTQGANVVLWSNSDGGTTLGEIVLQSNFSGATGARIQTNGGHIWLGGGSGTTTWNGITVGNGYAVSGSAISFLNDPANGSIPSGVLFQGAKLLSGGGNIYVGGQSQQSNSRAVVTTGPVEINSGSGTIEIQAIATTTAGALGTGWNHVPSVPAMNGNFTITSANATSSAILLNADATASNVVGGDFQDEGSGLAGVVSLRTTNGGGLVYNSLGSSAREAAYGLRLGYSTNQGGTLELLSNSGDITLNTGNRRIILANNLTNTTLGFKATTPITASTSQVKLVTNDLNASGALNFNTSGQLIIEPFGSSFTSAVNTTQLIYSAGVTGLTIGKAGNSSGITIGSTTTVAGPVTLFGGALAINGALTATNSTINLNATGAVTQTAALSANNLALGGSGTFTLNNAGNNVATLAAGDNTTRVGNTSFTDASGGLTIGTVGNTTGIQSTGTVLVETLVGDLTLSGNITTTNTTASAIILNAGKSTAIGTTTGGNILVTGTPTVTTGTGGIAKLFSGSDAASTGLTTLVGGASNTRDGVDETTTSFSPVLTANTNYALYRNALQIVAPNITSFTPTTAGNGETVVITGTGFTGVSTVKFGNVNATSFVVNSNTQITAVVGNGGSGDVLVQNTAGSDNETGFIFKVVELKFEGNTLDQTAADRDGTVEGTATYGPGASGQAICFTNTNTTNASTVSNYLKIPDNILSRSTFTISLRFKTSASGAILGYQNRPVGTTPSNYVPILYVRSDGKLSANLWQGSILNVTSTNRVDDGNWHKVEFSVTPGSISIYIDNQSVGTSPGTIQHLDMSSNQLGASFNRQWPGVTADWLGFTGCIDEFLIVDQALTASQIQQVTQLPLPTITSFAPTTAKSGETVTITGTNLGSASSVKLGGVVARRFNVVSATEISAIVPINATLNSTVEVTTAAGTISGTTFTYDCNSNALDFDADNDHVVIGDVIEDLGAFTQEAWVYWKGSSQAFSEIFSKEKVSTLAITSANKLHANFGDGSSWGGGVNSTTSLPLNTWTHVAVSRSTSGVVKLYINGVLDASTATLNLTGSNTNSRVIGGKLVGSNLIGSFSGAIDEVKAWNTERTAQQIITGLSTELVGNESGLIAYYNFNQGAAAATNTTITTLNNLTAATNFNGTLTNMNRTGATSNFVSGVWPVITTQPTATTTVCSGVNVSLTVSAVGPQLSYQWYSNNSASNTGGTVITGATSATYTYTTSSVGSNYFYAVVTGACSQTVTSTVSTVDVNATNWTKIYETTNPSRDASGEMVYTAGFGKTGGAASSYNRNFSRIKYRLENNVAGTLRWAEVSFDAWTNVTLADLQIPDLVNNILIQKNVSNIQVTSNMPGVHTGNFSTGRLEFWNMDYRTFQSDLTPAGDASIYDWDDRVAGNSNGHGSFQIHNVSPQKEQTIFAWNMHRNGGSPEIGIGNAPTGNPDWTFNNDNGSVNFKVQISVQDAPVITPSGNVSTCVGTPVTLTAAAGTSYLWSNGATTQSISTANAGNYTVTVTQANGCAATSIPKTVTVTTPPTAATITGTQEVCVGGTTQFNAGQNVSGTWTTSNGSIATVNSSGVITGVAAGNATITFTIAGSGGCANVVSTRTIAVNAAPIAGTLSGNNAICINSSSTFISTQTGGTWSTSAANIASVNPASGLVTGVAAGTSIITYTVAGGGGCAAVTATRTITVNSLPIITYPNSAYSFERTKAITAIQATSTVATVASYAISPALPTGLSFSATDGSISGTPSVVSTSATYTVSGTTAAGCSVTRTFTLQVFNAVAPSAFSYAPASQTVRQGTAITTLTPGISGGAVASFSISPALPAGITFNTSTGVISGTLTAQQTGTVAYTITATNSGGSATATVTLIYNTAPTDVALSSTSVAENAASGTAVGSLSATDADAGDTFTYTLVSGTGDTDNASFTITGSTLSTAAVFDFETKSSYSVRVRVTDAGGLSFEKAFTIGVTNVNEAPTNISASASSVAENAASGTSVATLSATDIDAGETFTYTLVSGTGDTDNASFTITGNTVSTAAVFDFETKSSYSVRVRVTDAGGLTFEKVFTINVTDVNEAPTAIALSNTSVLENAASGTAVGTLAGTDADAGDTHTYTLVAGTGSTDNASFTITGTTLNTAAVFNFEAKNSYTVRVRVTDAGGLSFERAFTITVTDVNEAPTLNAITDRRVYNVTNSQVVNLAGITAGPETAQSTTTSVSTDRPATFSSINVVGTQIQFTLAAGIVTPQDVVVTVRVRDNGGVANGGVDTIVRTFRLGIDPMPIAAASPNLITLGATAQLSAAGANAINYTWVAVGGSGIVGSGANINVRPAGTTTYAVVVTNSFGYQATVPLLLTVIVDYKLVPNNLVTPNGDGVNDRWVIPNIDMYPDNEVMVYDKAGRVVFAKRGYNSEWDGTVNGKKLKEDAYFYVIKFNKDGALPIRGYVSIVR